MTRSRTTRTAAGGLGALALLAGLAGCGSSDEEPAGAPAADRVLTEADLAPLEPTRTQVSEQLEDGSPYWSCGGIEYKDLLEGGLEAEGRYFNNGTDGWAVYSMLVTVPDVSATDALADLKAANDACVAEGQTLPELDLGEDRFGYESLGEGVVDARRGYAVVGEHELVQVTVFGLRDQEAPDELDRLLDKAVERAEDS